MSKPITSRIHGMLDYPVGIALIASGLLTQHQRADGPVVTRDVRHHGSPRTG